MKGVCDSQPRPTLSSAVMKWQKQHMLKAAPIALLLLAGCGGQSPPRNTADAPIGSPAQSVPAAIPAPKAVAIDEEGPLLDFHLAWPADISAIPALAAKLRAPAFAHKAELEKMASDDKAHRDKENFAFHKYEFGQDIEIEGNAPRLLSASLNWYEFTGGAHPNHGTKAILWDRQEGREISFAELFEGGSATVDALFRPAYCAALDKARAEKRSAEDMNSGPDDPFSQCPKFTELAMISAGPAGRSMTKITFHAGPYVAGPYVEGDYDIDLPVTEAILAALKPQYRSSFATR